MKILQIVSSSRISGAEKHVVLLSDRLIRRGHDVLAVCPSGGWLPEQLRNSSVPFLERRMKGIAGIRSFGTILRHVRHHKVDIIHAHLTKATYFASLIGRLTGVPVISSLHTRTHDLVYRRLMPHPNNRIITVSNFLRKMMIEQGLPEWMLTTVYNGTEFFADDLEEAPTTGSDDGIDSNAVRDALIDADRIPCLGPKDLEALPVRAELNTPPEAELVGLFGHVGDQKGHPLLVRAARSIVDRRPRAYFVFVGPAEPRIQKTLWEMASADGVADRIRYTGVRADVPRLMDAMDVITVPSQMESFGMVIIEAMARSRPVVAARIDGIPELICHDQTGLLIDRTPEELADAVTGLLSDPGRRRVLGRNGCEHARLHFSARTMVNNIEALYHNLLSGSP